MMMYRTNRGRSLGLASSVSGLLISVTIMLALAPSARAQIAAGSPEPRGNVAAHRPYSLSAAPNYDAASANAATVLTDGREAGDLFWQNGTALGWAARSPVMASISLAEATAVSHVRVQAGAKTSGEIYFPSQIYVFGGDGGGRFAFLGASGVNQDRDSPNAATLRQFDIRFPAQLVKEVVVLAFVRGRFLFLGEIAAFSAGDGAPLAAHLASLDEVRAEAAVRRAAAIEAIQMPQPTGPAITRRWAMPLSARAGGTDDVTGGGCQIARVEPWPDGPGDPVLTPPDAPLLALAGGRDYAAFRIINRTAAPAQVIARGKGAGRDALRWYALAHVRAFDYSWVPDVVVPFDGGALPPGSSMTVLAEVEPRGTDSAPVAVDIACGDGRAHFDAPVRIVASADAPPPLHGNLWTYLHEPPHAPVARALACEPGVLSRLGIDTVVVHPNALLDDGGPRPADLLARYFRDYRGAARALLFMDVKMRPWAFRKMPDGEAVRSVRAWWDWVQQTAKASGFDGEIILYPIDEPQPGDVPLLLKTRDLFRKGGVTARVYATVEQKSASALATLDILQLHRPSAASRREIKAAEVQGYDTRHDGKLLPVNGYYRMQGWQAFDLDLAGIGIWSAWDGSGLGDPASGWNPFIGTGERDFGMLYMSPEGCGWPSRRLLAWRQGMEENRILRRCAKSDRAADGIRLARAAIGQGTAAAARRALERVVAECG